jgi:hypothetical protein
VKGDEAFEDFSGIEMNQINEGVLLFNTPAPRERDREMRERQRDRESESSRKIGGGRKRDTDRDRDRQRETEREQSAGRPLLHLVFAVRSVDWIS